MINDEGVQGTRKLDSFPAMHTFVLVTWVGCLPVEDAVLGTGAPTHP